MSVLYGFDPIGYEKVPALSPVPACHNNDHRFGNGYWRRDAPHDGTLATTLVVTFAAGPGNTLAYPSCNKHRGPVKAAITRGGREGRLLKVIENPDWSVGIPALIAAADAERAEADARAKASRAAYIEERRPEVAISRLVEREPAVSVAAPDEYGFQGVYWGKLGRMTPGEARALGKALLKVADLAE